MILAHLGRACADLRSTGSAADTVLTHYGDSIYVRRGQASTRCHAAFAGVLAENGARVVQADSVGGVRLEDLHAAIIGLGARPHPRPSHIEPLAH